MLCLDRKLNERIIIGTDITITVIQIDATRCRIAVDAPKEVSIVRKEIASGVTP